MASSAFKGVAGRCPADCSGDRRSNACGLIAEQFDFVQFDTSELLIEKNRAAVEVPIRYRHRETGAPFESTKANFWTLEDGWPAKLTEYHDIARVQAFVAAVAGSHPARGRWSETRYRPPCKAASSSGVG